MKKISQILKFVTMFIVLSVLTNTSLIAQTNSENKSIEKKSENKITLKLEVTGMTCQLGCADGLDKTFKNTKGILISKTTYDNSSSEITYDPRLITEKEIIKIIKKKGFASTVIDNKTCSPNCTKPCCTN